MGWGGVAAAAGRRPAATITLRTAEPTGAERTSCGALCDPGANGDGGHTVADHIRLFPLRGDVDAGATRCTNRFCPACAGREYPCTGPTLLSGAHRVRRSGLAGSEARSGHADLAGNNLRGSRTIRSCSSTWARSPSSVAKTGGRRSTT